MTNENNPKQTDWTPIVTTPTYVTIPVPQQIDYKNSARFRGAQARIRNQDALLLNMSKAQGALIRAEADRLEIPYVSFVRWCSLMVAKALHKERTGEDLEIEL